MSEVKKEVNQQKVRNRVGSVLDVTVDKMRAMADSSTIIGEPMEVNGTTMIPVSKVSYGFASGGSDFAAKNAPHGLFAGGGGGGMTVTPVAFLVVSAQGDVKILHVKPTAADTSLGVAERAITMAPELIDQIKSLFKKDEPKAE